MEYLISELALIFVAIYIMTRIKRFVPSGSQLLKDLVIYLPPDSEKISSALANPSRFTLNCGYIDEKFSRSSPFFIDSEYLLLLGAFGSLCVTVAIIMHYVANFTLNTSGYLTLTMIFFCIRGQYLQFKQSGFRNPDNWMGLFYSMTLLCFSSMLLYLDHHKILDFNFHFSLVLLGLQITSTTLKFLGFAFSINHLLFCIIFSLILSLAIFPYFKYLFRSTLNYYSSKECPFDIQGIKELSPLYKYTLIFPFCIVLLWTTPVSNTAKSFINESYWEHLRILIVMCYCALRIYQLRNEVQILLDQGKNLIYEIIRTKDAENRKECELQCKAIGAYAWPMAHQSLCYTLLIFSLCLLLLCKGEIFKSYPKPIITIESTEKLQELQAQFDDSEFIYDHTALVTPSRTVSYYQEIKDLENKIKETRLVKEDDPIKMIEKLVEAQYIPTYFYRDCLEYAIWTYHLGTVLTIFLTLLYRRRYYKKLKLQ